MIKQTLKEVEVFKQEHDLPRGQLLRKFVKSITNKQIAQMLDIKGIREEYHNKVIEKYQKIHPKKKIYVTDYNAVYVKEPWYFCEDTYIRTKDVFVKIEKLNDYYVKEIPSVCYENIKKAMALGIQKFYVAYPMIGRKSQTDPLILGRACKTWWLIDRWE
jgi:hypothetical protein